MWYLTLVAAALAYLLTGHHFGRDDLVGFNAARILELALLSVPVIALASARGRRCALARMAALNVYVRGFLVLALVAGVVSSLFAANTFVAIQEVALYVLLFWAVLFGSHHANQTNVLALLSVLAMALAIYWVRLTFEVLTLIDLDDVRMSAAITGFSNFRFLNQVQSWVLPLFVLFWLVRPVGSLRVWIWLGRISAVMFASLVFVTGGRGIVLALLMPVAMAAIYLGEHGRRAAIRMSAVILGGLIFYYLAFQFPYYLQHGSVDAYNAMSRLSEGAGRRPELWEAALRSIAERPIMGIGPQHYVLISPEAAHPHNSILQYLAEWGLIGGLALLFVLVAFARLAWRRARASVSGGSAGANVDIVLAMSVAAGLAYSLVSGVFVMPYSQIAFVFVAALVVGRSQEVSDASRTSGRAASAVVFAVVAAAITTASTVARDISSGALSVPDSSSRIYPRFWTCGFWNTRCETDQPGVEQALSNPPQGLEYRMGGAHLVFRQTRRAIEDTPDADL